MKKIQGPLTDDEVLGVELKLQVRILNQLVKHLPVLLLIALTELMDFHHTSLVLGPQEIVLLGLVGIR